MNEKIPLLADIARAQGMQPTAQKPGELRFNKKGSLSINLDANTWFDHESETGGGAFDFVIYQGHATNRSSAAQWCKQQGLMPHETPAPRTPVREHIYTDEHGHPVRKAVKYNNGSWSQMRYENDGWHFGVKGVPDLPYGADRLAEGKSDELVFIFEGEKDCERAWQHGLQATCNVGGANKWRDGLNASLTGRQVCIAPDDDPAGEDHARAVQASLQRDGIDCFVLWDYTDDLPHKADFSDWMDANCDNVEQFVSLAKAAQASPQPEQNTGTIIATPFKWLDPATIPRREFLYGRNLIRKQVSVTVAPGGVGKSTLGVTEAVAMASGRDLLGDTVPSKLKVWLYNLEDERVEMQRRIIAAMQVHDVAFAEIKDRLFYDTGRERPLCTAITISNQAEIIQPVIEELAQEITRREIDVMIIDPFVSSHQVNENDNGAIDQVAKEWVALADRCNCAIELVHHTRKAYGQEVTSESGRGATALLAAARSARVLNKMSPKMREDAGLPDDHSSYFSIDRDKANLAPEGAREWRCITPFTLANSDSVGVCKIWQWPDAFSDITPKDTLRCQNAIEGQNLRFSDQAANWVGATIAKELGLDLGSNKKRLKTIIRTWLATGVLVKKEALGPQRKMVPVIDVGEWMTQ